MLLLGWTYICSKWGDFYEFFKELVSEDNCLFKLLFILFYPNKYLLWYSINVTEKCNWKTNIQCKPTQVPGLGQAIKFTHTHNPHIHINKVRWSKMLATKLVLSVEQL